eukprot:TRINITY_DN37015_c0_g1_i1.p1 TRINITY_DN37015_c0_g1~~TRINITY_DN37015_c0_g1_i1.p1  ORF type:complete len:467 (-),score=21.39 TRINITY_DN37015_c0_g1_i1:218-1618(-)
MLWKVVVLSALGGFLFGYDLGLISGALPHVSKHFSLGRNMDESVVSITKYAGVLGTVLGGAMMLKFGRKKSMSYHSLVFVVGFALCALCNHYLALLLGRFTVGLGYGISAVVIPQYLGEMAPIKVRGRIVVTYEVVICVGTVCGAIMDHLLHDNWRAMMALPIIPALLCYTLVGFLPESPQWLMLSGDVQAATQVLNQLPDNPLHLEMNVQDTESIDNKENNLYQQRDKNKNRTQKSFRIEKDVDIGNSTFGEVFYRNVMDMLLVLYGSEGKAVGMAVVLAFFNQACASTAIINYAPTLLGRMGAQQATLQSALIGVAKGLGVCGAVILVDRWGRKPLLISGGIGCGLAMCLFTRSCQIQDPRMCLIALCLFIFCFSISQAGVFWVVVSELFSMKVKSPAASLAMVVLFLSAGLTNQTYLSLYFMWGCKAFLFYSAVSYASALYVYLQLPETKGKSLKEIQALIYQ